jgi:hypothetical protein
MRKFLAKVLYYFLPFILLILSIELFISFNKKVFFKENQLEKIYHGSANDFAWINSVRGDSLVFLCGSSSVKYGLSCSILNELAGGKENFVNLAMNARSPLQTYFILKELDLSRAKAVYFGLDPWIYTKRYYKHQMIYLYADFSFTEALEYSKTQDKSCFIKRYSAWTKLFSLEKRNINNVIPNDYGSEALDKTALNFNERVDTWFQIDKYGWSDLQFEYLEKMAQLCSKRNVSFYVFIPPKRSDYSDVYKKECKNIHQDYIHQLEKVNFLSPIFGTFDQLDSLGDYQFFQDAYHLNKQGQEFYSNIFYELMQENKVLFDKNYKWFKSKI